MTFEFQNNKKNIPLIPEKGEKLEWGQWIEKEIYIPFLQEALGDVFDLAIKTSKEVDGDISGLTSRKEIREVIKSSPKVDIIARFKENGLHLAIQGASIDLSKKGGEEKKSGEEILSEKKMERANWPMWDAERICKDNETGYSPKEPKERIPKVVLNLNPLIIEEAQAFWAANGKKNRIFDCLFVDRDIKNEAVQKEEKEKSSLKLQTDILGQIEDELKNTSDRNENWRRLIEPRLKIIRGAMLERQRRLR